jgi:hypothetical protein
MGMITSIRAPLPVADAPKPVVAEPRPLGGLPGGAAGPVSAPMRSDAVVQVARASAGEAQLMTARQAPETSAAVAAEAARSAYIKASIAAGISPLPLP